MVNYAHTDVFNPDWVENLNASTVNPTAVEPKHLHMEFGKHWPKTETIDLRDDDVPFSALIRLVQQNRR